jgi:heme o synthase
MVALSAFAGFYLAGPPQSFVRLIFFIVGIVLSCSGSAALNQYLERDLDAKMDHTKSRPIPAGSVSPVHALNFGLLLTVAGATELVLAVNLLAGFLSLLTSFIYIIIYTPMKRLSPLSTSIGAVPGALPPVIGWAAARGEVDAPAWILFFIVFVWQHTHFYAIARIYREDYLKAGFKVIGVDEPEGKKTFRWIFASSLLLIPVSVLPVVFGLERGGAYATGSVLLGAALSVLSARLIFSGSEKDTRLLFRSTLAYLPAILILIIFT